MDDYTKQSAGEQRREEFFYEFPDVNDPLPAAMMKFWAAQVNDVSTKIPEHYPQKDGDQPQRVMLMSDVHTHVAGVKEAADALEAEFTIREISVDEYRARGGRIHMKHSGFRHEKHRKLAKIIQPTHGRIVYCEQVTAVLHEVAGFPTAMCEVIRKAIAKKNVQRLSAYRELFRSGLSAGFDEKETDALWDFLESSGGHTFNRSHAYVYHQMAQRANRTDEDKPCGVDCLICNNEKANQDNVIHTVWGSFNLDTDTAEPLAMDRYSPVKMTTVKPTIQFLPPISKGSVSEGIEPLFGPYLIKHVKARIEAYKNPCCIIGEIGEKLKDGKITIDHHYPAEEAALKNVAVFTAVQTGASVPKPEPIAWDLLFENMHERAVPQQQVGRVKREMAVANLIEVEVDPYTGDPITLWQNCDG